MNWDDLAKLRLKGQKPLLSLVVTTWPKPWRQHGGELWEAGVMVITHEPGTPMPVELLQGLRVILALESCDQTTAVCQLLRRKGVNATVHGWCACYREFTVCPSKCAQTHEQVAAVGELNAA